MVMKIELKKLIKNLAVPLGVGFASGFLTRAGVENFKNSIVKPFFTPPSIVFPIVWTVLYVLMGISTYLIESVPDSPRKKYAMKLFYVQLIFNFLWSFIFFIFEAYFFAFIWLLVLLVLIILLTREFFKIEPKAGYCMIPYVIWLSFAGILTFSVYLLN